MAFSRVVIRVVANDKFPLNLKSRVVDFLTPSPLMGEGWDEVENLDSNSVSPSQSTPLRRRIVQFIHPLRGGCTFHAYNGYFSFI